MIRHLFLKFMILVGLLSFVFHFVWEWYQCAPFFVHRGTQASPMSMAISAFGDVVLTFLVLALVYFRKKRRQSVMQSDFQWSNFVSIEITAFLVAVGVEKLALATKRWSYADINPVIPGIGVSVLPVLQLMLLIPVVVFLTVSILRRT